MDDSGRKPANDPAGTAAAPRKRRSLSRSAVRSAAKGDVAPSLTERGIADFSIAESVAAATESKAHAVRDILGRAARGDARGLADSFEAILAGASPDDIVALRNLGHRRAVDPGLHLDPVRVASRRRRQDIETLLHHASPIMLGEAPMMSAPSDNAGSAKPLASGT